MSKLSVKALNPPCVEYLKELGERLLDSDTMRGLEIVQMMQFHALFINAL